MKRIEATITPSNLDTFKSVARELGITEFDIVEVYRSSSTATEGRRRLYRGREFVADLAPRLKLEFVVFDDDVQTTLHQLSELVHPESIAVFQLDQTHRLAAEQLTDTPPSGRTTNQQPAEMAMRQIIGIFARNGSKRSR
ncbi:MAG: P-II family nitrogen regulator [Candidatus Binataceae bacterium]